MLDGVIRGALLAGCVAGAAACSASSGVPVPGLVTVHGTIHGIPFVAAEAGWSITPPGGAGIGINTSTGACEVWGKGLIPRDERRITIYVADRSDSGVDTPPQGAGTYPIHAPWTGAPTASWSTLLVFANDENCNEVTAQNATAMSGAVTMTRVDAEGYEGSGEVVLDTSEQLTFSFLAPACAAFSMPAWLCE